MFKLCLDSRAIPDLAKRYEDQMPDQERRVIEVIVPRSRQAGYFSKPDFLEVCAWKTPRSKPHCQRNSPDYIQAVTHFALSTPNEQLRIEILTLLAGIGWPTASVFLHLAHTDPYPILDRRVLWSLNIDYQKVVYNFEFWWSYVQFCRQLAEESHVSMRTLDRALFWYSYENEAAGS